MAAAMTELTLKQGGSLLLALAFTEDDGSAADLTGSSVSSQIRDAQDSLVAALPVVVTTPTAGTASIAVMDTSAWPLGTLRCDIRVQAASTIMFYETFAIHIQRAVTQ